MNPAALFADDVEGAFVLVFTAVPASAGTDRADAAEETFRFLVLLLVLFPLIIK